MRTDDNPVQEPGAINDLFAEDLARIEILGDHVRLVFWRWKKQGCDWHRLALDWAIVLPARALKLPIDRWPDAYVVKAPGVVPPTAH